MEKGEFLAPAKNFKAIEEISKFTKGKVGKRMPLSE